MRLNICSWDKDSNKKILHLKIKFCHCKQFWSRFTQERSTGKACSVRVSHTAGECIAFTICMWVPMYCYRHPKCSMKTQCIWGHQIARYHSTKWFCVYISIANTTFHAIWCIFDWQNALHRNMHFLCHALWTYPINNYLGFIKRALHFLPWVVTVHHVLCQSAPFLLNQ